MNTFHELVENHIPLANKIASMKKRSLPRCIDIEDLRSAAYLGLVEAASRFDDSKGVTFLTFAYPRIWGSIIDFLRGMGMCMTSLDAPNEDGTCLADTIESSKPPLHQEEVLEVLSLNLDDQAKELFRLYFYEDLSMKETGKFFGVTESRISQLFKGYKSKIQEHWTAKELREEMAA